MATQKDGDEASRGSICNFARMQAALLLKAVGILSRIAVCCTISAFVAGWLNLGDRTVHADEAAMPDFETVRREVDSATTGIKTLQGKLVARSTAVPLSLSASNKILMHGYESEMQFLADIENGKTLLELRESYHLIARDKEQLRYKTHRVIEAGGERGRYLLYTFVSSPGDSSGMEDLPYQLIEDPQPPLEGPVPPPPVGSNCLLAELSGLRINGRKSLANLLHDPTARVEGQEEINGAVALRVCIGPSASDPTFCGWLDPSHDYLPVRWVAPPASRSDEKQRNRKLITQVDVLEFGRFSDPADGKLHWFPIRGTLHNSADEDYEFEIAELQVNATIDPARLAIQSQLLPDGVMLPRGSYTGGRADLGQKRSALTQGISVHALSKAEVIRELPAKPAEDNAAARGSGNSDGTGEPEPGRDLPVILGAVAAAALIAVAILAWYMKRRVK